MAGGPPSRSLGLAPVQPRRPTQALTSCLPPTAHCHVPPSRGQAAGRAGATALSHLRTKEDLCLPGWSPGVQSAWVLGW